MPINSASRLYALASRAKQLPEATLTGDAWAKVFELPGDGGVGRDAQVAHLVSLAHAEPLTMRAGLVHRRTEPALYEKYLKQLEHIFSLQSFGGHWKNVLARLSSEVMAVLALLPELLPSEHDRALTQDEWDIIKHNLDEVRIVVDQSALPRRVIQFLSAQLELFQRALREYPIRGGISFQEASDVAAAQWLSKQPDIEQHIADPAVQRVASLWDLRRFAKDLVLLGTLARLIFLDAPAMLNKTRGHPLLPTPTQQLPEPNFVAPKPVRKIGDESEAKEGDRVAA